MISLAGEKNDGHSGYKEAMNIQTGSDRVGGKAYVQSKIKRVRMRRHVAGTSWVTIHGPSSTDGLKSLIYREVNTGAEIRKYSHVQ